MSQGSGAIVEKELSDSSHDLKHVDRVYKYALALAENYEVDLFVLKISALIHDIARGVEDRSDHFVDHAIIGAKMATEILRGLNICEMKIEMIAHCIRSHRFNSAHSPVSVEAKILFDADKIDIMGATGIARSFMFSGKYNMGIESSFEFFSRKIQNIRPRLYTVEASKICDERLVYMEKFFERLTSELEVS